MRADANTMPASFRVGPEDTHADKARAMGRSSEVGSQGGMRRLTIPGPNPTRSALHSGFSFGADQPRPSRVRRAHTPAAGENRVAVRACSQGARCKSERIRWLAEHRSQGACELSTGIGDPARGRYPVSLPVGVGGPLGDETRTQGE